MFCLSACPLALALTVTVFALSTHLLSLRLCTLPFLASDEKVEYSYINLLRNAERYTGYKGEHANRVWGAIYSQDIFKGVHDPATPPEQLVFYR